MGNPARSKTDNSVVSLAIRMKAWYDARTALLADGAARLGVPPRRDLEWKIDTFARASRAVLPVRCGGAACACSQDLFHGRVKCAHYEVAFEGNAGAKKRGSRRMSTSDEPTTAAHGLPAANVLSLGS